MVVCVTFKRILCGYEASDLELDFLPLDRHIQLFLSFCSNFNGKVCIKAKSGVPDQT